MADVRALYTQVLPEYLPKLLEAQQAAARDLSDAAVEVPVRRKDGETRWVRLRARPERQPEGQIVWNGVWTDITECVADQERLRQSEAQLRAVGDSLPDSAIFQFELDQDGRPRFLYLSAGFERITGLAVDEPVSNRDVLVSQNSPRISPDGARGSTSRRPRPDRFRGGGPVSPQGWRNALDAAACAAAAAAGRTDPLEWRSDGHYRKRRRPGKAAPERGDLARRGRQSARQRRLPL